MDRRFWEEAWDVGKIGFHQHAFNRHLMEHVGHFTAGHTTRVLVPLCGKTLDMTWLAGHFEHVVGVEIVEAAVRAYFAERSLAYGRRTVGGLPCYQGADITIFCADVLAVTRDHVGPVDCIYDRAALVALPAEDRRAYAAHLTALVDPGARMLLLTLHYDQARADGPPFSVPDEEVRALYEGAWKLERLDAGEAEAMPPRFEGAPVGTTVWLLTRR